MLLWAIKNKIINHNPWGFIWDGFFHLFMFMWSSFKITVARKSERGWRLFSHPVVTLPGDCGVSCSPLFRQLGCLRVLKYNFLQKVLEFLEALETFLKTFINCHCILIIESSLLIWKGQFLKDFQPLCIFHFSMLKHFKYKIEKSIANLIGFRQINCDPP